MAETNGLLNRRTGHSVPGVRIPLSPRYKVLGLFSGCSTVGSMPGLGPGGRQFESGHPDKRIAFCSPFLFVFNGINFF